MTARKKRWQSLFMAVATIAGAACSGEPSSPAEGTGGASDLSDHGAPAATGGTPGSGATAAGGDAAVAVDAAPPAPPPRHLVAPSTRALRDEVALAAGPVTCGSAACSAQRAAFFAALSDLGVHRVRFDLRWNDIERSRGTFDFSGYDRAIDAAAAAHVDVLGILAYSATWANTHHDEFYPPDDFHDFVHYATATVTHFAGRVRAYEVWNEPNAGFTFWKSSFGGDPKQFGNLATQTADAIALLPLPSDQRPLVAPGGTVFLSQFVPVLPPGTIPAGVDFARDAFAANPKLASRSTAFSFHGYGGYPPRNAPESAALGERQLGDKVTDTAQMLEKAGWTFDKPLWLTEIGWPTANGVTEDAQARWSVRAVVLGALLGLDGVYLYTLRDGVNPPAWSFAPESSFGLTHADGSPKRAYHAIKTLTATVGAYRITRRVVVPGMPGDVYVVELGRANGAPGRAWIAWRSDDGQGPTHWRPPSAAFHAVDLVGAPAAVSNGDVTVTADPLYVLE